MIKRKIGLILVFLITLFAYFPALFYHFVGDDYFALEKLVTSENLKQVFSFNWPGPLGGYLRPLQWLPYLLGYTLAGLPLPPDPRWQAGYFLPAYHILSLIFHLANVFLVYLFASFVFKRQIYVILATLIFAVHPINSEVVCWTAVFGDVAFTFFSLLSIILFAKFCLTQQKARAYLYYSASILSFILALLSKESALCVPFLMLVTTLFLLKTDRINIGNKKWKWWKGYLLPFILYFIIRPFVISGVQLPEIHLLKQLPWFISKLVYFLRDLMVPVDLTLLKQFLYAHSFVLPAVMAVLFLGIIFLYIFRRRLKNNPLLIFSLIWVGITLILPLFAPFSPSQRQVYFPLVGYSLFLVSFLSDSKKRRGIPVILLLVVLQFWGSFKRCSLFQYTGEVVSRSLTSLKQNLPSLEKNAEVFLVGIPGTCNNTPAFWVAPEEKIRFAYQDKDLAVSCLSLVTFGKKDFRESRLLFLDDFTLIQSLMADIDIFLLVPGYAPGQDIGHWQGPYAPKAEFRILERDKFGHISKVIFRLNKEELQNKKIYIVAPKGRGLGVLKTIYPVRKKLSSGTGLSNGVNPVKTDKL